MTRAKEHDEIRCLLASEVKTFFQKCCNGAREISARLNELVFFFCRRLSFFSYSVVRFFVSHFVILTLTKLSNETRTGARAMELLSPCDIRR